MSSVVVCGGSVLGSCVAMMFAADGHDVTVLEADPQDVPSDPVQAWDAWDRKGVAQFRQPHNLFSRFRAVCDEQLPGLTDAMLAAGCVWVDYLASAPPTLAAAGPSPDDDRLRFVSGRRPVVEAVVAAAALEHAGVTVRRGVGVAGLLTGASALRDVPHVTGVRTTTGEQLSADLVVDATGRRSKAAEWLTDIGARPPYAEAADSGFIYYTRYFTGPQRPGLRGRALTPFGSISLLTLDGDNDTWSVTAFTATGDAPLKELRRADTFTRVVSACPLQAHWLDGTPITDVLPMAGILDRYRRFTVDEIPVVTGFAAVGDAWACTNPSAGRGLSVGIVHAEVLREVARQFLTEPAEFARHWDAETERRVTPFYRNQIAADHVRLAEMAASREGTEPLAPDPSAAALMMAAGQDPVVFRGLLEIITCLALPQEVLMRPGMAERIGKFRGAGPPPDAPGPDRARLLELMAG